MTIEYMMAYCLLYLAVFSYVFTLASVALSLGWVLVKLYKLLRSGHE